MALSGSESVKATERQSLVPAPSSRTQTTALVPAGSVAAAMVQISPVLGSSRVNAFLLCSGPILPLHYL